jgi:hypothetical protein
MNTGSLIETRSASAACSGTTKPKPAAEDGYEAPASVGGFGLFLDLASGSGSSFGVNESPDPAPSTQERTISGTKQDETLPNLPGEQEESDNEEAQDLLKKSASDQERFSSHAAEVKYGDAGMAMIASVRASLTGRNAAAFRETAEQGGADAGKQGAAGTRFQELPVSNGRVTALTTDTAANQSHKFPGTHPGKASSTPAASNTTPRNNPDAQGLERRNATANDKLPGETIPATPPAKPGSFLNAPGTEHGKIKDESKAAALLRSSESQATPSTQKAEVLANNPGKTPNGSQPRMQQQEPLNPAEPAQAAKSNAAKIARVDDPSARSGFQSLMAAGDHPAKPLETAIEGVLRQGSSETGITRALNEGPSNQSLNMATPKTALKTDSKPWLQGSSETSLSQDLRSAQQNQRLEAAQSGSSFQQSHGEQQGRGAGSETYRQYAQEMAEIRSTAQAATQSQFLDRSVASQLSSVVVNQILNHLEKLRESDRGRIRVNLGNQEMGTLAVQISIAGGVVRTLFEGDASLLNQIESDWHSIRSRASERGVSLGQPEFISHSLASGGASLLPDDAVIKGNQNQSVIQQSENQPVRPEFQTAVSGNSGPVHLYA